MDPLYEIKKISGPMYISIHTYKKKRILFLGDTHFSNKKMCNPCKYPDCVTVKSLLHRLDVWHKHNETGLDVFLESGSSWRTHPTKLDKYIQNMLFQVDMSFQKHLTISGPLLETIDSFYDRLYYHKNEPLIRFHYLDIRNMFFFSKYGFDINRALRIIRLPWSEQQRITFEFDLKKDFFSLYPTKKDYLYAINQLCFSKIFSLKTSSSWTSIFPDAMLLSNGMTKVAKQFYKLPRKLQPHVRSYILNHFGSLWDPSYKQHIIYSPTIPDNFMKFYIIVISSLTDVYAFCRALFYFLQQPEGSTLVFYSGYIHTLNYEDFFHSILHTKQISNKSKSEQKVWEQMEPGEFLRCLNVEIR